MRKVFFIIMLLGAFPGMREVCAQGIGSVLESVEANNLSLRAHADLTKAQSIGARVGNSLGNPDVEYNRNWGSPARLGVENELTVVQEFDFPAAYFIRGKLAKLKDRQFLYEHSTIRQQILLEAKTLCIEIIAGRRLRAIARQRLANASRLCEVYAKKLETGEGTILEKNKVEMEKVAAANDLNMVNIELEAALNRLKTLNGGQDVVFPDSVYTETARLAPLEEMIARYEQYDPTLLASGARRESAGQAVKASRAEILPKLEVGYKHEFSPGEKFHGMIVGMNVPVFAGRRELKQAKAEEVYARTQYESDLNDVRTALTAMYARAEVLAGSLAEYSRMAGDTHQYQAYLDKALNAGQISVVDYFTEIATIYEVQESEIHFDRDYRLAEAQINAIDL